MITADEMKKLAFKKKEELSELKCYDYRLLKQQVKL